MTIDFYKSSMAIYNTTATTAYCNCTMPYHDHDSSTCSVLVMALQSILAASTAVDLSASETGFGQFQTTRLGQNQLDNSSSAQISNPYRTYLPLLPSDKSTMMTESVHHPPVSARRVVSPSQSDLPGISPSRKTVQFTTVTEIIPDKVPAASNAKWESHNSPYAPVGDKSEEEFVDPSILWYSSEDFENFKTMAVDEARQINKSQSCSKRSLRTAYEETILVSARSQSTNQSNSSDEQSLRLEELPVSVNHCCEEAVGIEALLDRGIYRHRKRRRLCLLKAVDKIQSETRSSSSVDTIEKPQQQSSTMDKPSLSLVPPELPSFVPVNTAFSSFNNSNSTDQWKKSLLLRRACEKITKPAQLFASYLGTSTASLVATTERPALPK